MIPNEITPEELWSRQQISNLDVDYDVWDKKRKTIIEFSQMSQSCIFMVDVFKGRYDFASENFSCIFGYDPTLIDTIREQGDLLEERIHQKDKAQLLEYQIEHGLFIYSLPPEDRNNFQQIFQFRVLNMNQQYINVISRQHVVQKDKNGKAWIVMGIMDISPDQVPATEVKRTVVNRKTGEIIPTELKSKDKKLTNREKEILLLVRQGLLSKEIADKLNLSIYTVSNHRKNILSKLNVDNVMEAINMARDYGIIY